MLRLEEIQANATLAGLEPSQIVRIGDNALIVNRKKVDGDFASTRNARVLNDETNICIGQEGIHRASVTTIG